MFHANITIFNDATRGSNYLDKDCVDTKVALNTGCMKIVFLNKFVKDLLVSGCSLLALSLSLFRFICMFKATLSDSDGCNAEIIYIVNL